MANRWARPTTFPHCSLAPRWYRTRNFRPILTASAARAAEALARASADDRSRLLYLAVKRSRAPLFAGIGAATLDASLSLAREARDAGAAALLLPPRSTR